MLHKPPGRCSPPTIGPRKLLLDPRVLMVLFPNRWYLQYYPLKERQSCMPNENISKGNSAPGNAVEKDTGEKLDRRSLVARVGRFVKYTAPALIVMMTAKHPEY